MKITEAIGYDGEVSEPNGPVVHGYFTARWADSKQPEFDRWVNNLRREALNVAVDAIENSGTGTTTYKTVHANFVREAFAVKFGVLDD